MTTTAPSRPRPIRPSRRRSWPAVLVGLLLGIALASTVVLLTGDTERADSRSGSGVAAAETRTVAAFTAVELAGTMQVTVQVGRPQQVVVRADDNLLGIVLTEVHAGVLVVSDRGNFTSHSPMSVAVTVPALRSATLSGTGELAVTGVAADTFTARLPGTGTLSASGRAGRVDVSVPGDGTAMLTSLLATDATVTVAGTGSVLLSVTGSLHGTVSGTGSIVYTGHPEQVSKTVTGVGSITGD